MAEMGFDYTMCSLGAMGLARVEMGQGYCVHGVSHPTAALPRRANGWLPRRHHTMPGESDGTDFSAADGEANGGGKQQHHGDQHQYGGPSLMTPGRFGGL